MVDFFSSPKKAIIITTLLVMIVSSSAVFIFYSNSQKDDTPINEDITKNINSELITVKDNVTARVEFKSLNEVNYYKGESISFNLSILVKDKPAYIENITFQIQKNTRQANQTIIISQRMEVGETSLALELKPGFSENGFIALSTGNYTLNGFSLNYKQMQFSFKYSDRLDLSLIGELKTAFDQLAQSNWNITTSRNITLIANNSQFNITSTQENGNLSISTMVNTTGYVRIEFEVTGSNQSYFNVTVGNNIVILNSNESGYAPIGNMDGMMNLNYTLILKSKENISVTFTMITQYTPILTVIANNNWEDSSVVDTIFREPQYYLDQANIQFVSRLNISFIPVAWVDFDSSQFSTNLVTMRGEAESAVGKKLQLEGNKWQTSIGTDLGNQGADVLIIFTNKTMDHLGIVFGSTQGDFNLAINARGSLNTGNTAIELRLPSLWADNLIQHELSHIFDAPDRWTEDSPASIMTKSRPDDAFSDIINNKYWLVQTNWLEIDLQKMYMSTGVFRIQ